MDFDATSTRAAPTRDFDRAADAGRVSPACVDKDGAAHSSAALAPRY